MNYDNYEDDARYAKEIFWESKGLGYTNPAPAKVEYVRDAQCPRCKRWASSKEVAYHTEKNPDCDK